MVTRSPGFTDLSASRMMPLMKLATIFCRPKPIPTPAAPEKIASADRLMPTALITAATAKTISASRIILTSSTWIDGVRSADRVIRLSTKLAAMLVSHSASTSSTPSLISSNGVSRSPPSTIETEFERLDGRAKLAENAQRRHQPGRHRHQRGRSRYCG